MIRRQRFSTMACAAAAVALFAGLPNAAVAQHPAPKQPKPDLHAGGAKPTTIPNDETTEVVLPGFHFTGARVETDSTCKLESYRVTSDNEIRMKLIGTRNLDDKDGQCTLTVRTPSGSASTWIVVEYTEAQEADVRARDKAKTEEIAKAFIERAGKVWHLTFAGGATETFTSTGVNADGMPTFVSRSGTEIRIAVTNPDDVLILESGCMLSGKLVGNQVRNGESRGECSPSGSWTATVER